MTPAEWRKRLAVRWMQFRCWLFTGHMMRHLYDQVFECEKCGRTVDDW